MDKSTLVRVRGGVTAMLVYQNGVYIPNYRKRTIFELPLVQQNKEHKTKN